MSTPSIDRNVWPWVVHPTLMYHEPTAMANLHRMAQKAQQLGLRLRPHFKTHQSRAIGQAFRDVGVTRITVSSIEMAEYFADAGWQDILIAFPVNVRAMDALNRIAEKTQLSVLVSDAAAIAPLNDGLRSLLRVWIEVDTGDGRSGFQWNDADGITRAMDAIGQAQHLRLQGILGHAGYTYRSTSVHEVLDAHNKDINRLTAAVEVARAHTKQPLEVSTGDTPGCSLAMNFGPATEIRPGNFIFYDVQQALITSCEPGNIAVALAAPVVAIYPERGEAIVHGGGVHLGKDAIHDPRHGTIYGWVSLPTASGWTLPVAGAYLRSISQEHGVAVLPPQVLSELRVGDLLAILPVHSCMCADLMTRMHPTHLPPADAIPMMKAHAE